MPLLFIFSLIGTQIEEKHFYEKLLTKRRNFYLCIQRKCWRFLPAAEERVWLVASSLFTLTIFCLLSIFNFRVYFSVYPSPVCLSSFIVYFSYVSCNPLIYFSPFLLLTSFFLIPRSFSFYPPSSVPIILESALLKSRSFFTSSSIPIFFFSFTLPLLRLPSVFLHSRCLIFPSFNPSLTLSFCHPHFTISMFFSSQICVFRTPL